jgi:hypothetical protein
VAGNEEAIAGEDGSEVGERAHTVGFNQLRVWGEFSVTWDRGGSETGTSILQFKISDVQKKKISVQRASRQRKMACYAALLHQPPASPSPCTSSRAASCRVRPAPLLQRRPPPSYASARISSRCSYAAAGGSAGAGAGDAPAAALRRVLETPGAHQAPACYDALSARLVERAGFRACFTSGTCSLFCLCRTPLSLAPIIIHCSMVLAV